MSRIKNAIIDSNCNYILTNSGLQIELWSLLNKKKIDFPLINRLIQNEC
jgi:hypothetical protein